MADWYVSVGTASPVSGAFAGVAVDSFPPGTAIAELVAAPSDWTGLTAQAGRRGTVRPVMLGRDSAGVRRIVMGIEGLWRWAFRGGSSEQGYRGLVASSLAWLLGGADSAAGRARVLHEVVQRGRPVIFEWIGAGRAEPTPVVLTGASTTRTDTLAFDGAGRAELILAPGTWRYRLTGGGQGTVAVEEYSDEWLPAERTLAARDAVEHVVGGRIQVRSWFWLFGLGVVAFAGEWLARGGSDCDDREREAGSREQQWLIASPNEKNSASGPASSGSRSPMSAPSCADSRRPTSRPWSGCCSSRTSASRPPWTWSRCWKTACAAAASRARTTFGPRWWPSSPSCSPAREIPAPLPAPRPGPTVILVVGVNGAGKTTSIAKLARRLSRQGERVLLGAADTYRAGAVAQLEIWAERLGLPCVSGAAGGDPAAVAFDAIEAAQARGMTVAIIDTAGRLHTQEGLMEELSKLVRVIARKAPGAPHETLLVLDGSVGQNAVQQGKLFTQAVHPTGLIVTKLDGTARGGAVVALRRELALPIRFLGTGEQADDLEVFDPASFAEELAGSGE